MTINNVSQHLLANADKFGEKIMYIHNNTSITYNQFVTKTWKIAQYFKNQDVCPQQKIIMMQTDCIDSYACFHALTLLGATIIMLDTRTPLDTVQKIISETNSKIIIGDQIELAGLAKNYTMTDFKNLPDLVLLVPYTYNADDELVYFATSGTTGHSKLVIQTHQSFVNSFETVQELVLADHTSVVFSIPKIAFSWGICNNIIAPLLNYATYLIMTSTMSLKNLHEIVNQYQVTHLTASPHVLGLVIKNKNAKFDPCLKRVLTGSESVPPIIASTFQQKFQVRLNSCYGMSETLSGMLTEVDYQSNPYCIGKPIADNEFKIVDDNGDECSYDQPGRLLIKTKLKAKGYFNDPESTNQIFKGDWIYTNDIVKKNINNNYYHLGRIGYTRKLKSHWINLIDVENLFYELPDLVDCCAEFTKTDSGEFELLAQVVIDSKLSAGELKLKLSALTKKKYLIPKKIIFTDLIPRTLTNKKIRNLYD